MASLIFFFTLDYNQLFFYVFLLLKLFQLWPLGAFSVGSCVPLTSLSIDRLIDWILFSFLPLQKCSRHFWGCFRLVWVFPGCSAYSSTLPALLEPQVPSLGQEDPLEKELATHPSILDWEIPWTEEPGVGSQRAAHDLATKPPPPHRLILYVFSA